MVFGRSENQSRQEPNESTASSSTVSRTASFHASNYEVVLERADDPQQLPLARRWLAVLCISTAAICITCASSMVVDRSSERSIVLIRTALQAAFAEEAMGRQFHVSQEVTILGISLFVLGLGIGPLVAGPMSEIYGRSAVYSVSFSFFFVFMFPIAFAPNISKSVVALEPSLER